MYGKCRLQHKGYWKWRHINLIDMCRVIIKFTVIYVGCNLSRQNKWTSSKLLVENKSEKYVLQFQSIYIVHVYYYSIRVSNLTL